MEFCLKALGQDDALEGAAKAGFDKAEIGLLNAQRSLSRGGSLGSILSSFRDAGLSPAVQIPLSLPYGFGGGMGSAEGPDPEDLLALAGIICTNGGASLVIVDPFVIGPDFPLMPEGMIRDDVRLSLLRLIAGHPYLRPCLRPSGAEGSSVKTLSEAAAVLESLNRHEAGLCCDLSLLGDGAADDLRTLPQGMVRALRLCSDPSLNRAALKALEGSRMLVCASLGEAAALRAAGGIS